MKNKNILNVNYDLESLEQGYKCKKCGKTFGAFPDYGCDCEKKPMFIAPCNLTANNIVEFIWIDKGIYPHKVICVRYKCGKIKWKDKNYKKNV